MLSRSKTEFSYKPSFQDCVKPLGRIRGVDLGPRRLKNKLDEVYKAHLFFQFIVEKIRRPTYQIISGPAGHRNKILRTVKEIKKEELEEDIPDEFLCPITREIMTDPVIAAGWHSFWFFITFSS